MDADTCKAMLAERAEEFARWLFPAGKKNGVEWQVGSLNGEAGKSLSIRISGDKVGVFRDFATSDGGDNLVELFAQAKSLPFKEALGACSEWLGDAPSVPVRRNPGVTTAKALCRFASDVYDLTDEECRDALRMIETLASDSAIQERIARTRTWKPETILQLAREAHLGWHEDKLAFIYDTGVKLRWRSKGEREIRWAFGKPWLWRAAWISQSQKIYLCEGETDAITLIDEGFENEKGTVVVATPSASTFDQSWATLFQGKDVILAFDNDKAGTEATARVSTLLRGIVRSLSQLNWKGLQYATAS
jgi:twinkle protein